MPQRVKVEGLGVVEFPDGMDPVLIKSIVDRNRTKYPPLERIPFTLQGAVPEDAGIRPLNFDEITAGEAGVTQSQPLQGAIPSDAGLRPMTLMDRLRAFRDEIGRTIIGPLTGMDPDEMQRSGISRAVIAYNPRTWKAPFPQYAEKYPAIAPSVPKVNKSGNLFPGKGSTPATRAFMNARTSIANQMETEGFEPFFDPEKRFDVDPSKYRPPIDTYTVGLPKKQETIDRWRRKVQTKGARERLQQAYDVGVKSGGHDRFYMLGQIEKEFKDELGAKEGRARFQDFVDGLATTTKKATPEANFLMAQYGNYLRAHGLPYPKGGWDFPPAVGNLAATGNLQHYDRVINKGKQFTAAQPKENNFTGNFRGNVDHGTIDSHMTELITPKYKAPPKGSYFAYEELVREMAEKNGVSVREFQEVAWGGKRFAEEGYAGKSMIQTINESIERTHRLTGMPKKEIVRKGLVRGQIGMYGVAGAVGLETLRRARNTPEEQ